jgi:tetratricopeptide (TPR) repeat protein
MVGLMVLCKTSAECLQYLLTGKQVVTFVVDFILFLIHILIKLPQVQLLMEKVTEAMNDFNKAVTVNPNFPVAYVQKCYTDYRYAFSTRNMEKMEEVMKAFQQAIQKFPHCSECYTLFAQVCL